ncbi:hypothetical protein [Aureimonas leprariae]|uniref:Uncharacterized protein n=1 Tax=Plantimonas leprariae TaxID=2615207 RepID=A0A7V7PSE6_9HYPH|nr:hypothetical protein [Aureimonas leprariae]KAB0682025.1 hypothetical protein F6X38_04260 [Aureimonas leprariae]
MKGSVFRGLLAACITIMLAVFAFASPGFATERIGPAGYELRVYDPVDIGIVATPAITVDNRQMIKAPSVRSSAEIGSLTPAYHMSMLTDGQSLRGFHMRC